MKNARRDVTTTSRGDEVHRHHDTPDAPSMFFGKRIAPRTNDSFNLSAVVTRHTPGTAVADTVLSAVALSTAGKRRAVRIGP